VEKSLPVEIKLDEIMIDHNVEIEIPLAFDINCEENESNAIFTKVNKISSQNLNNKDIKLGINFINFRA
jgi:hypothetical protein